MPAEIILALDVPAVPRARYFVDKLYPQVRIFKIGLQLFSVSGPAVVKWIRKKGAEVFLDLKFYDIPNTVAAAVRQAVRMEVKMLTLHISGGRDMLEAAVQAARQESAERGLACPLLLGVTVLTSREAAPGEVLKMAREGLNCGLDGIVCSAQEAAELRSAYGGEFKIITPGIRPDGAPAQDQKRTATVTEAVAAGSDYLVIGRPILEAEDPVIALKELKK
ncbi:MAG: orotidine-5'-phosphate decarboxylase [Candidatus Omnitrophota bacterium]